MLRPIDKFVQIETQGAFSLWINKPVYKIYKTTRGYIRNTKTGDNVGQTVELHINLYDECNNKLDATRYDEDCYEIVEG